MGNRGFLNLKISSNLLTKLSYILVLPGIIKFVGAKLLDGGAIIGGAIKGVIFDVLGPLEGGCEFLRTSTTPLRFVIPPKINV